MPLGTVLVVEDDQPIRRGIVDALKFAGYKAFEAADGEAGLAAAISAEIDLVLLDILMPKKNGFAVLEELRRVRPALPVIVLTARGAEEDRVRGLRTGADDYVVKPFSAKELLARIQAVLRRSAERPRGTPSLTIAGRTIDFERREIRFADGRRAEMSEREAAILQYLAANRGRAIARSELLSRVWGLDPRGLQTRAVDMHIARLREQLGDDPAEPRIILTVRSKGYMLAEGQERVQDSGLSVQERRGHNDCRLDPGL
jgi:DNA-binding response OmpR family regulator